MKQQDIDAKISDSLRRRGIEPTPERISSVRARLGVDETPAAQPAGRPLQRPIQPQAMVPQAAVAAEPVEPEQPDAIDLIQAGFAESLASGARVLDVGSRNLSALFGGTTYDQVKPGVGGYGGMFADIQSYLEGVATSPENTFNLKPGEEEPLWAQVSHGLGSAGVYGAATLVGGAVAGPIGAIAAPGLFGAATQSTDAYFRILDETNDEDKAWKGALMNIPVGASESLGAVVPAVAGLAPVLSRLNKATNGALVRNLIPTFAGSVLKSGLKEGGQEFFQGAASEAIDRYLEVYPEDRRTILEVVGDVAEKQALPGAGVGLILGPLAAIAERSQARQEAEQRGRNIRGERVERPDLTERPMPEEPGGFFDRNLKPKGARRVVEMPEEFKGIAEQMSKRGLNVYAVETEPNSPMRGAERSGTGDIYLNVNRRSEAVRATLDHEVDHKLETRDEAGYNAKAALIESLEPEVLAQKIEDVKQRYAERGVELDENEAKREATAMLMEEEVFPLTEAWRTDPTAAAEFVNDNRTAFKKIVESVMDVMNDFGTRFDTRRERLGQLLAKVNAAESRMAPESAAQIAREFLTSLDKVGKRYDFKTRREAEAARVATEREARAEAGRRAAAEATAAAPAGERMEGGRGPLEERYFQQQRRREMLGAEAERQAELRRQSMAEQELADRETLKSFGDIEAQRKRLASMLSNRPRKIAAPTDSNPKATRLETRDEVRARVEQARRLEPMFRENEAAAAAAVEAPAAAPAVAPAPEFAAEAASQPTPMEQERVAPAQTTEVVEQEGVTNAPEVGTQQQGGIEERAGAGEVGPTAEASRGNRPTEGGQGTEAARFSLGERTRQPWESPENERWNIGIGRPAISILEVYDYALDDRSHGDESLADATLKVAEQMFGPDGVDYLRGKLRVDLETKKQWDARVKEFEWRSEQQSKKDQEESDVRYSLEERDRQYMDAVKAGDMTTAQRMVDEAARAAGYTLRGFHGTNADFTQFNVSRTGNFGPGVYLSFDEADAREYARRVGGSKVLSVVIRSTNPFRIKNALAASEFFDLFPAESDAESVAKAQAAGYDAVLAENDAATQFGTNKAQISVFDPSQVKLADPVTRDDQGNVIPLSQRFQPESSDIRFSLEERQIRDAAESGIRFSLDIPRRLGDLADGVTGRIPEYDTIRTTFVDYLTGTKALASKAAGVAAEKIGAVQATLLRKGIVADRLNKIYAPRMQELAKEIQKRGVPLEDINEFMRARMSPLANKRAAEINKTDPSLAKADDEGYYGGAYTDAEAADVMSRLEKQDNFKDIVDVVKMVDAINELKIDIAVRSGRITNDLATAMRKTYDLEGNGFANPHGFVTGYGSLKSAPESTVIGDEFISGTGIGRGIGKLGKPFTARTGTKAGVKRELVNPVVQALVDLNAAVIREVKAEEQRGWRDFVKSVGNSEFAVVLPSLPTIRVLGSDGYIHSVPDPMWAEREGVLPFLEDGKWKAIEFKGDNKLIAEDLKGLTVAPPITGVAKLTQKMTSLMTRQNPVFFLTNIPRDFGWALATGYSRYGRDFTAGYVKEYARSARELFRNQFMGEKPTGSLAEYISSGAPISTMGVADYTKTLGEVEAAVQSRDGIKFFNAWEKYIGGVNDVFENASRLAAFKVARQQGKSVGEAALVAKQGIALNFEQTGRRGRQINSLYGFFSAGINGTDAALQLLRDKDANVRKKAATLVALTIGLGAAQEVINRLVSDYDDDGKLYYDGVSSFEKNRNAVFMTSNGNTYTKVPLPFGFNALYAFGRNIASYAMGAVSAQEAATDALSFFMESASPFGAGPLAQVVTPTILDPYIQMTMNQSFTGAKIAPDLETFGREMKAPHDLYWRNTPEAPKWLAAKMAEMTEQGKTGRGYIDVRPDMIEHMFSAYSGGVGSLAIGAVDNIGSLLKGAVPEARQIVGVNRLMGNSSPYAIDKRYADARDAIEQARNRFNELREERRTAMAMEWRKENATLFRAYGALKATERRLDRIDNTVENEEKRRELKARFNKIYFSLLGKTND